MSKDSSVTPQIKAASLGGKAVRTKTPPAKCPKCNEKMTGRKWHSYLGHLGLHGLADRYFDGDMKMAQERLRENSLARQDAAPWNDAWPDYKPIWAVHPADIMGEPE